MLQHPPLLDVDMLPYCDAPHYAKKKERENEKKPVKGTRNVTQYSKRENVKTKGKEKDTIPTSYFTLCPNFSLMPVALAALQA